MHNMMQQQRRYAGGHLFFFLRNSEKENCLIMVSGYLGNGKVLRLKGPVRPCSVSTVDI